MLSIRLPKNLEKDLNSLAKAEGATKTEIVKNALLMYIENLNIKKAQTPYDLGKDLFGKYSSDKVTTISTGLLKKSF